MGYNRSPKADKWWMEASSNEAILSIMVIYTLQHRQWQPSIHYITHALVSPEMWEGSPPYDLSSEKFILVIANWYLHKTKPSIELLPAAKISMLLLVQWMGCKCLENQWNRKVYQFHESVSWMKLKYEYTIYTFFHIYMVLCNSILDMNFNMSNFYSLCLLYFHKSKIQFSNNTGNLTKVMKRNHLQIFDHLWVKCHWNGNVFILMKFSSLAALKVVRMTTSSAASDENFVKMTTFSFQW